MNRLLCCCAILALGATSAHADGERPNIDLTTFTCGDFVRHLDTGHEQEMQALATWLDGYLSGISGNTELNWQELKHYTHDLTAYCRNNASTPMQEAARKAGM